jgi:hypothetical protein
MKHNQIGIVETALRVYAAWRRRKLAKLAAECERLERYLAASQQEERGAALEPSYRARRRWRSVSRRRRWAAVFDG